MNQSELIIAIRNKQKVQFYYKGNLRVCEPLVLGYTRNDELNLLTRQTGGHSSSGGLPDFRMFTVNEISSFQVLDECFTVVRGWTSPFNSQFEREIARV